MNAQELQVIDEAEPEDGRELQSLPVFSKESDGSTLWAAPLRMAAAGVLLAQDWPQSWSGGCEVITAWHPYASTTSNLVPDIEKHRAYQKHMAAAMLDRLPWLSPLLDMAGATLYVAPGMCCYQLRTDATLHEIPDLLPYSELLPWVTEQDAALPQ